MTTRITLHLSMRHGLLICMLLFQQFLYAQDWQLFRKGAKSIYESNGLVYSFSIDTTRHNKTNLIVPNPAVDHIKIENVAEGTSYQILSVNGSIIQMGDLRGSIDVSSLTPGWYCLEIPLRERLVRVPFIRQ